MNNLIKLGAGLVIISFLMLPLSLLDPTTTTLAFGTLFGFVGFPILIIGIFSETRK